jgi:hypothetical protein
MITASGMRGVGIVIMLACVCPGIVRADVELVSVGVGGAPANGDSTSSRFGASTSSANGRFVVFSSEASNLVPSDTNGQQDVFVRDRTNHITRLVSLRRDGLQGGNASSGVGVISPDGRLVAFSSAAANLVPGTPTA